MWTTEIMRCLAFALLAVTSTAAPIQQADQTVLSPPKTFKLDEFFSWDSHSMRVNMTFDRIDLSQTPKQHLKSVGFIDFDRFEVMNTTAAIKEGILSANDTDAAASKPNALHSIPQKYRAPSVLRSNVANLANFNLSQHFDLISFAIKPLTANSSFALVEVSVYDVDFENGKLVDFDSVGIGFPKGNGEFYPIEIAPRDYFAGWGTKVNYVEFQAYAAEDNAPLEIAVDNVVMQFHGDHEDGYSE